MEQLESKAQFSPQQNEDTEKNSAKQHESSSAFEAFGSAIEEGEVEKSKSAVQVVESKQEEEVKEVIVDFKENNEEEKKELTSVQMQGIETLLSLKESYDRLLDRIPRQLKQNCMEVEVEVKNMLFQHLENMKDNAIRQIKGNEAEQKSRTFLEDIQKHIAQWREKEFVKPQDLIELGTFAGKHDTEKQNLEKYLTRYEVMLMFNSESLKKSLKDLVKVQVVDKERERLEEEERKRAAQKQKEEKERKAAELRAKKLAEEAAAQKEKQETKEGKYLIQPVEGTFFAICTDITQRKMKTQSFKDASGSFIFPQHAACCSYEDCVLICGGKGENKGKPYFMSETLLIKYPHYLFLGPDLSEPRYDMAIAVVDHKLMATGGFHNEHLAICERLNLKTMRKDVQERRSQGELPGRFGGNYERIGNLVHKRSSHACCSFQNSCYVICGYNWEPIGSIERYYTQDNHWKEVKLSGQKDTWDKKAFIGAIQVDEKELIVYGYHPAPDGKKEKQQNKTLLLKMEETEFHVSSLMFSREIPILKAFKFPSIINSKGALFTFDHDYHLWRFQRDWQCIVKEDLKLPTKPSSQGGGSGKD